MSSKFLSEFFTVAVIPPKVAPEIVVAYHGAYPEQLDENPSLREAASLSPKQLADRLSVSNGIKTGMNHPLVRPYSLGQYYASELLGLSLSEILRRALVRTRMYDLSVALAQCLGDGSTTLSIRSWMLFFGLAENEPNVQVKTVAAAAKRLALAEQ